MNFDRIEQVFKDYVDTFDWSNEKIRLKYFHTIEVANVSYELANRLNLTNEEQEVAKLIGYLHDIGRFIQMTKTNTFKDKKMDHATEGVKILFEDGLIRNFITEDKYDEIIKKAVNNHNKYEIIDEVNNKELLFANIIRDCDKIDIFRVCSTEYKYKMENIPSSKVLECFDKEVSVKLTDIKNKSDSTLCILAFIYDFNYKESIDLLNEKGYYIDFINSVEVSEQNVETFNKIKKKVLKKLEV